jgi:glucosamine 6-phosphate synthetase-like amidotransferase/phosphosugar isomerase protein
MNITLDAEKIRKAALTSPEAATALKILAPEAFRENALLVCDGYVNIGASIVREMATKLREMEYIHGEGKVFITLHTGGSVGWNPSTTWGTELKEFV